MASISGLIVTWVILVCVSSVVAQDTSLVEAPKKEGGKVIVYGSLDEAASGFSGKDIYFGSCLSRLGKITLQRAVRMTRSSWFFPSKLHAIHGLPGVGDFAATAPE